MRKEKLLLIGPLPKPIHGMSICNELIINKTKGFTVDYIDTANKSFSEDLGSFRLQKVFSLLIPYSKIFKIIKTNKVYLTPGQTFYGVLKNLPFLLFSKIFNKEIIIHIHGNFLGRQFQELEGIKKVIFKKTLQLADKGIVLSESLIPNLSPFLNEKKIFILYNFVEKVLLNIDKEKIKQKKTDKLKIVYLSNLMTEKGIFDLLRALSILHNKKIPFEAEIAGNIDSKIEKEVFELINNNENINYLGVVRGTEKKNLLLKSNVFVFPTYYKMEGQPISILESMAAGNIVLTTKHAGIPDIFSTKNGYYIDKKSPEDIALKLEKINTILESLNEIMYENYLHVNKNYNENYFLDNFRDILNK